MAKDPRKLILEWVKETGRLVVAHEAVKRFGVGGEVAVLVSEQAIPMARCSRGPRGRAPCADAL
jgi:pyruvate/2-oxoglutarate/acetoin dehydrogenase E1 component